MCELLQEVLREQIQELQALTNEERLARRYEKLRRFGNFLPGDGK